VERRYRKHKISKNLKTQRKIFFTKNNIRIFGIFGAKAPIKIYNRKSFIQQQIGLKYKKETNGILCQGRRFVRWRKFETSENMS